MTLYQLAGYLHLIGGVGLFVDLGLECRAGLGCVLKNRHLPRRRVFASLSDRLCRSGFPPVMFGTATRKFAFD